MPTRSRGFGAVCFAALLIACAGCGDLGRSGKVAAPNGPAASGLGGAGEGPFGPQEDSPLLAPFAGTWTVDFEKTLAARKAAGATDEQLAQLRSSNPQGGGLHPDITITGNQAVDAYGSEYTFFAMHEHVGKLCGKAWHHEDRFDPGDMSKCYVRLELKAGDLLMDVKMSDRGVDLNDPDLLSEPSAESGSAASCDVENPAGEGWSNPWVIYVFTHKG